MSQPQLEASGLTSQPQLESQPLVQPPGKNRMEMVYNLAEAIQTHT